SAGKLGAVAGVGATMPAAGTVAGGASPAAAGREDSGRGGGAAWAIGGGSAAAVRLGLATGAGAAAVRGTVAFGADCASARGGGDGCATGPSAGRVTVPPRLKFWSTLGPTESAGAVVAGGGGGGWASAIAGASISPTASNGLPKRETALICSRSNACSRQIRAARQAHAPRLAAFQARRG